MSQHANFSPSGMKRKALCPASHKAESIYPDSSSTAAIDGTHTHTVLEHCLTQSPLIWDASTLIGISLKDNYGTFDIDKARTDRAQVALDFVKPYVDKGYKLLSETKVDPGRLIFRMDWWGTADIVLISPDGSHIIVADYKDGSMMVDPMENGQGISYMLGVMGEFLIFDKDVEFDFVIIQPKALGVSTWRTTAGELNDIWLPKMVSIINACEAENPEYIPGDEQCQFCSHKQSCEARRSMAIETANVALANIQLPTGESAALPPSLPAIGDLSEQQLSQILDAMPVVKSWLKDVAEEALRRVETGAVIPDFKLIQKSGRRAWIEDTLKIFKTLTNMSANGERIWKKKDITDEKPISFSKILGEPRLTDNQRKKIEDTLLKKPMGKKTLVPVSEKGKDISPAALLSDLPDLTLESPPSSQPH